MSTKTPIRYPGGKARAIKKLQKWLPSHIDDFREPFMGGASMALHISHTFPAAKIWVNDLYFPLYTFWTVLRDRPSDLIGAITKSREDNTTTEQEKAIFVRSKEILDDPKSSDLDVAHAFYVRNRCSFSGLTSSGSFAPEAARKRWTMSKIKELPKVSATIQNWKITNTDYKVVIDAPLEGENPFIFGDPPYDIQSTTLYGRNGSTHKNFDHQKFADDISGIQIKTLITYNDNLNIRSLFNGWSCYDMEYHYSLQSKGTYAANAKKNEVVLLNYGVDLMQPITNV